MIAPNTLVAANVIPRRINEVKTVPKIPAENKERLLQQCCLSEPMEEVKTVMPKNPTAMPNNTHKNAGVIVIRAVYWNIAARTPITMLEITALAVQFI